MYKFRGFSEAEKAVAEYLHEKGVTMTSKWLGLKKMDEADSYLMDAFIVTFQREDKTMTTDYFMGVGHRLLECSLANKACKELHMQPVIKAGSELTDTCRKTLQKANDRNIYPLLYVMHPTMATVIASILRDDEATRCSFSEWCCDLGYDIDSRKAYATYELCQQLGDKVNNFFTGEERSHLAELLEDY